MKHEDPLLDHEYDGIREYDNPLPGWWTKLFWLTIFFSIAYLFWSTARSDFGVMADFERDMQEYYDQQTEQLLALGEIDEVLLATLMKNKGAMKDAAGIFQKTCKTCHKKDGSGDIGPNLTDEYWLHGNTLMQIYAVVKDGKNKMPAWKEKMPPINVMKMAAYVGLLRTKNLSGKAPTDKAKKLPPAPVPDTTKKSKPADGGE